MNDRGGGGVLQISSDGNDQINGGKNQNPKKFLWLRTKIKKIPRPKISPKVSHAEFPNLKNFQRGLNNDFMKQMQCNGLNIKTTAKQVWLYFIRRTMRPDMRAVHMYQESSDCFEYPKNPYLNLKSSHTEILAIFSYPKQPRNQKFQNPQKILRSSPSL